MAMYANWVHGSALTVESPGNLERVGHFGWGADMVTKRGGQDSWFHIALPTPVIVETRTTLTRFYLLFWSDKGRIHEVHLWDGPTRLQVFDNLNRQGEHRSELDGSNTFSLASPTKIVWGVGISFFFQSNVEFDDHGGFYNVQSHFILAAAGGDFFT